MSRPNSRQLESGFEGKVAILEGNGPETVRP